MNSWDYLVFESVWWRMFAVSAKRGIAYNKKTVPNWDGLM